MAAPKRTSARKQKGLGEQRYIRYVAAFDRVADCVASGHHLECIAILDSLISDRLASRLGYLIGHEVRERLTCGDLCKELLEPDRIGRPGAERDAAFRIVILEINAWCTQRNVAIHATAKVFRGQSHTSFSDLLQSIGQDVTVGIELLRRFDVLDMADRKKNKAAMPATYPHAFFPERR